MSGVEAAIDCGEHWFGVGIEVSGRDQNLAIWEKWTRGPFGIELPLTADLIYIEFGQKYSKTVASWVLRDLL